MARNKSPQTFEKRQRERRKRMKREEKFERRLERKAEKRRAKAEGLRQDGADDGGIFYIAEEPEKDERQEDEGP